MISKNNGTTPNNRIKHEKKIRRTLKLKGVSLKKNKITSKDYENVIANNTVIAGKNINLQFKNNMMSKLTVNKNALTGTHIKMICLSNQACAPYIHGLKADDYIVLE